MTGRMLKRGDTGEDVELLQSLLNRTGAMLLCDGEFGAGTQAAVEYAQDIAGIEINGTADTALIDWLQAQPEPFPLLSCNGIAYIAAEETGGLKHYFNHSRWPHYPGVKSGITIGVGYDLRMHSASNFHEAWGQALPAWMLEELAQDIGRPGSKKRAGELKTRGVEIPFKAAWPVFIASSLPTCYQTTVATFPVLPTLPDSCRTALISLVFNRGCAVKGKNREEMHAIQQILAEAESERDPDRRRAILAQVEDQILAMKRLWNPDSGLIRRRQAEANLWRQGLQTSA